MTHSPPAGLATIDEMWDYGDPATSEVRFRDLAAHAAEAGEEEYRLEVLTQLARTLGLQRRFDEGHAVLDQIAPSGGDVLPGRARTRFHLERGRLLNSGGSPAEALPHFRAAWDAAREQHDDGLAVDAAHMMAIVEDGETGRKWNVRALELAESSQEPEARRWRASLLNNQGWDAYDAGEYDTALGLFERALAARRETASSEGQVRIARWCVAKGLRAVGRPEDALAEQMALAGEFIEPEGFNQEELGECLLALGRSDEARPHFAIAYRLLSQDPWLTDSQPERLARLERLGAAESSGSDR